MGLEKSWKGPGISGHKKCMNPTYPFFDQPGLVLQYGFWGNFSCRTWWVVLSGQDSSILPAQVHVATGLEINKIIKSPFGD